MEGGMSWLQLIWYIFLVLGLTLVYGFVWSLCKTASDADDFDGQSNLEKDAGRKKDDDD